jgi:hypothetical protein
MANERTIASLYARRRNLTLGLQDFQRRAEVYRSTIAEVEAKLRALVPFVPPFKPRKRSQHFTPREFMQVYYDALRELEPGAANANSITVVLMRRKALDASDVALRKSIRRRVVAARRRIKRRNATCA